MSYTITTYARKVGISPHTLRFYEKEGLLAPARAPNGHRIYGEQDLTWLEFIKRLKATGMTIQNIKRYAQLRALGPQTMAARMDMLLAHQRDVSQTLNQWHEHMNNLELKIAFYADQIARSAQPGYAPDNSSPRKHETA